MYHGIIIDQEFIDKSFPKSFKVFAKRQAFTWGIYGIEIGDSELQEAIAKIQAHMKISQPWYAHLYNDSVLIVIFKDKVIKVKPQKTSWKPIIDYGMKLNISEKQLDFWPNRFQDEIHYFKEKDFRR